MRPGEHEKNEHTPPTPPQKVPRHPTFSFGYVHSIPRKYQTNKDFQAGSQERIDCRVQLNSWVVYLLPGRVFFPYFTVRACRGHVYFKMGRK